MTSLIPIGGDLPSEAPLPGLRVVLAFIYLSTHFSGTKQPNNVTAPSTGNNNSQILTPSKRWNMLVITDELFDR